MMGDCDYMKALWNHFYGVIPEDSVSYEQYHRLNQQLAADLRKQLLRFVDCQNAHTERVSLESFIAGFRLAAGISHELIGEWYSFERAEEDRASRT